MYAVVGTVFLAGAILAFYWAFIAHRQPSAASGWLRYEFASQMICFLILAQLLAAVSHFALYAMHPEARALGLAEAGLLAAVLAVLGLGTGLFARARRRLREELAGEASVHELPGNGPGPSRTPRDRGGQGTRRKAA